MLRIYNKEERGIWIEPNSNRGWYGVFVGKKFGEEGNFLLYILQITKEGYMCNCGMDCSALPTETCIICEFRKKTK